jgi:hypothetical protein
VNEFEVVVVSAVIGAVVSVLVTYLMNGAVKTAAQAQKRRFERWMAKGLTPETPHPLLLSREGDNAITLTNFGVTTYRDTKVSLGKYTKVGSVFPPMAKEITVPLLRPGQSYAIRWPELGLTSADFVAHAPDSTESTYLVVHYQFSKYSGLPRRFNKSVKIGWNSFDPQDLRADRILQGRLLADLRVAIRSHSYPVEITPEIERNIFALTDEDALIAVRAPQDYGFTVLRGLIGH